MPFLIMELFEHYDTDGLNEKCLTIIHNAMFSGPSIGSFGIWNYFLGNIPVFLNMIDYHIEWDKLCDAFYGIYPTIKHWFKDT